MDKLLLILSVFIFATSQTAFSFDASNIGPTANIFVTGDTNKIPGFGMPESIQGHIHSQFDPNKYSSQNPATIILIPVRDIQTESIINSNSINKMSKDNLDLYHVKDKRKNLEIQEENNLDNIQDLRTKKRSKLDGLSLE